MGKKKIWGLLGAAAACVLLFSFAAFAADKYKTISSVRIKVDSSLANLTNEESLPSISSGDFSVGDSAKYYITDADWYNDTADDDMNVGDQPKIRLYLEAKYEKGSSSDIYYRFSGSYNSSNVRVTNGTFVSAKRKSQDELEVVIRLKGIKGTYDAPDDVYWGSTRGQARWNKPDNTSGYYEVVLKRGSSKIQTFTTNGTSLNLYPWMDKEGDYTFEVRTIPYTDEQKRYGTKSDTNESDELYISNSDKSDGSGKYSTNGLIDKTGSQTGTSGGSGTGPSPEANVNAGWIQSGSAWYFKYPNGSMLKNQWLSWNGKWYRFDQSGMMQTGWYQNASGLWYYLNTPNGDMRTGWLSDNGWWYFLNPTQDSFEGSMLTNHFWTYNGRKYYFDENGHMVTGWLALKDANGVEQYYYFYPQGKVTGAYGYLATNTTVDGFKVDAEGRWVH